MGKIIEAFAKQTKDGRDYFIATLDIDSETNEGYCLEVGDGYTYGSTSFGHGDLAKDLAYRLFEAVANLAKLLSEKLDVIETNDIQGFWDAFCEEFEDGWLYYNDEKDVIAYSTHDGIDGYTTLHKFIKLWHPDTYQEVKPLFCPHCGSTDIHFFESKGSQIVDEENHVYHEPYTYECRNETCQGFFDLDFVITPLRTKVATFSE